MKLLVQSDDYGITRASALGALHGIRNGIIRNTGFFTNMPWAQECWEWISPLHDEIALGVDLNASTGPSILGHEAVPGLTHEDGSFLTSRENRALDTDENDHDHICYDEVYAEFSAQIQRFIEMTGTKPDYLHGHAYGTKTTHKASIDLARKYNLPFSSEVMRIPGMNAPCMDWYIYPPTPENQMKSSLKDYLLEDKAGLLQSEMGMLITHCGYVDNDLCELSSFNLYRMRDLYSVTSIEVLQWVKENGIELITYRDLPTLEKNK